MSPHPNTTPASPSLASPLSDASFDSIESLTKSFAASEAPTFDTTTVIEVGLSFHRITQYTYLHGSNSLKSSVTVNGAKTYYDDANHVIEVRTPRYFDSSDTEGFQKARETWTYNGRGLVATHTEATGSTIAATESFTYDLRNRQLSRTDYGSNTWTQIYDSCCDKQSASVDPLGHGTADVSRTSPSQRILGGSSGGTITRGGGFRIADQPEP